MHPERSRTWPDLPASVRSAVEDVLGAAAVAWSPRRGGFSPGTADVVTLVDGRRAFVKAASAEAHPVAPQLHRREAVVLAALPRDLPVPRLLGAVDDGTVVALVVEHVPGRSLGSPWTARDLAAAAAALDALAVAATPCPVPDLALAEEHLAHDLAGWSRLEADPHPGLDPWAARHLAELVALGSSAPARLAGDTLVHGDIRGDNLMLADAAADAAAAADRGVVVVDWPHACRGADWFDGLSLVLNGWVDGGLDPDVAVGGSRVLARADPDDVTAVLAGMAGYFLDAARQPAIPALPTVRAFQRWQGDAALVWLRRRLPGWR